MFTLSFPNLKHKDISMIASIFYKKDFNINKFTNTSDIQVKIEEQKENLLRKTEIIVVKSTND